MDIDEIIELCILYQKTNHGGRTSSYDKCRRDLKHILEAVQKDIQHNSTDFITGIANYFWQNQKRMVLRYKVELDIYRYMLTLLKSKFTAADFKKADASIGVLCEIVEHGPRLKSKQLHTRLQDAANHANICQRNWDYSIEIPENDISALVNVAKHMPTKQNLECYQLVVSNNREFNKYFLNYRTTELMIIINGVMAKLMHRYFFCGFGLMEHGKELMRYKKILILHVAFHQVQ